MIHELNLIFISIVNLFGHVLAFFSSIYWMLALLLSSLKLIVAAIAMAFLLSIVIPAISTTIKAWILFIFLAVRTVLTASLCNPLPISFWACVRAIVYGIQMIIALIFAIISTIFMIIVIFIYIIISNFVSNVLKHTTPSVPEDESTQENLEESSE